MAQAKEWRGSPSGGAVGSGRPGPWNRLWDARVLGFLSSRGPDGAVSPTCPPRSLHLLGSVGFVAGLWHAVKLMGQFDCCWRHLGLRSDVFLSFGTAVKVVVPDRFGGNVRVARPVCAVALLILSCVAGVY